MGNSGSNGVVEWQMDLYRMVEMVALVSTKRNNSQPNRLAVSFLSRRIGIVLSWI